MKTRRCITATLTLAGLAFASSALAQYSASPSPAPTAPSMGSTSGTTTTPRTSTTGTTYDIRDGEIIAVSGNAVVIKSTEGYRQYTVAPDYRFMINGQPMAIAQVKPGMRMTAQLQTTQPVVMLTTTEMRNAEVVSADGMSVVIKDQNGQQKTFSDRELKGMDLVLMKDGRVVAGTDLRPGDRVTAVMLTQGSASASGSTTTPRPYTPPTPSRDESADVASSSTYRDDASARSLPKTASPWPLVGLAGLLLVGIGGAVTLARRFYVG